MKIEEAMKAIRQGKEVWIITRSLIDEHTALSEFLNADDYEVVEPAPELISAEDETVPETKPKKPESIDHGKICALYKAGWACTKIADEMRCTTQTVINHLKKEGIYKNET